MPPIDRTTRFDRRARPEAAPALGSRTVVDEDKPIRDRIIEAADRCFRRYGVTKTTIEDIAAEVGVSRATIYRYVEGGREEIVLAVLLTEAAEQFGQVIERFADVEDPADRLVAIMVEMVFLNRENDQLSALFNAESLGMGSALPGATDLIMDGMLTMIEPLFEAGREAGQIRADVPDRQIAEWLLRIVMSLLSFEGDAGQSRERSRELLESFLIPSLAPQA
jgi:AcrR family transcriptional regulator